ncbi:MAG: hypothetical protein AAF346_08350 [Pseudomonadota bacterium]
MPISAKYAFVVSMDVDPAYEDLFNEVYDTEHVPYLLEVDGVHAVNRMKGQAFQMAMAGEISEKPAPSPSYVAIYEIDSPDVLTSDAWAEAVERGRWGADVRPHTTNRSHVLYKVR